jgi:hypothetical protein
MKLSVKHWRWMAWLGVLALAACGGSASKATADWLTNPDEAMQTALQKNRPLFIAFVGMDWSGPSQGIVKDVFDTPIFKDFADNNLVLLRIDLARKVEGDKTAQLNEKMAEGVQIESLPTCLLWDAAHNSLIGRFNGFGPNGPGPYLQQLQFRLDQWRQAVAQQAAMNPNPLSAAPQLSAPPVMTGVPSPQDLLRQPASPPLPSALSVTPDGAPGSSSLPTPEQLMQQLQQPPPQPTPSR